MAAMSKQFAIASSLSSSDRNASFPDPTQIASVGELQTTLELLGWTRESLSSSRDACAYRYVGSNGSDIVETEEVLQFMLENGIPNIQNIKSKEERNKLERAIKFWNVPMSDLQKLASHEAVIELIQDEKAISTLLQSIGFQPTHWHSEKTVWLSPGVFSGSAIVHPRYLSNLAEVGAFIRMNVVLMSRNYHIHNKLSREELLALQLWAALSPEPLPIFKQQPRKQLFWNSIEDVGDSDASRSSGEDSTCSVEASAPQPLNKASK